LFLSFWLLDLCFWFLDSLAKASSGKAACVAGANGMVEAMPFQSYLGTNLVRVFLRAKGQKLEAEI
jgi:hypothetical protein